MEEVKKAKVKTKYVEVPIETVVKMFQGGLRHLALAKMPDGSLHPVTDFTRPMSDWVDGEYYIPVPDVEEGETISKEQVHDILMDLRQKVEDGMPARGLVTEILKWRDKI